MNGRGFCLGENINTNLKSICLMRKERIMLIFSLTFLACLLGLIIFSVLYSVGSLPSAGLATTTLNTPTSWNCEFITKYGYPGLGMGVEGNIYEPYDVIVDNQGLVYVSHLGYSRPWPDNQSHIQIFSLNGTFLMGFGTRGRNFTGGDLWAPLSLAFDSQNNIYVANVYGQFNGTISVFSSNGIFLRAWNYSGFEGNLRFFPVSIAVDSRDNVYVVNDQCTFLPNGDSCIQVFDLEGNFLRSWGSNASGADQFNVAEDIAIDSQDNIYVTDFVYSFVNRTYFGRVQVFDTNGQFLKSWNTINLTHFSPESIAVDSNDRIYIGDRANLSINVFDSSGQFLFNFRVGRNIRANYLDSIYLDSQDNIYVADHYDSGQGGVIDYSRFQVEKYSCYQQTIIPTPNSPPNATIRFLTGSPFNVSTLILFDGSRSIDTDGRIVSYSWNFGDSTFAQGPRVNHSYRAPGNYLISLNVTDDDGASDIERMNVAINARQVVEPSPIVVPIRKVNITRLANLTSCSDTDGSNPLTSGRVTSRSGVQSQSHSDRCISQSNYLWEYSCQNNTWKKECYKCDYCTAGHCVNSYKNHPNSECEMIR